MNRRALLMVLPMLLAGCDRRGQDAEPYDLDFDIPRSEAFPTALSDYGLFAAPAAALVPADGVYVYELTAELYTDEAYKQRLLAVPEGAKLTVRNSTDVVYPEGTIMAKTFYYPEDMQDEDSAYRIIETRLLVKTAGTWNVATYLWNEAQTDATLLLDGTTTDLSWTSKRGQPSSTTYAVPHEGECVTCHQHDGESAFIGPTLRNLNRLVVRDDVEVNQFDHLAAVGVLDLAEGASAASIVDYNDVAQSQQVRARSYLDANCAHCHGPNRWDGAAQPELDLRFETPLGETGLERKAEDLVRQMEEGEMPYLGVTLPHEDGIRLVVGYIESL